MEVHPSYTFTTNQWNKIPNEEKKKLRQERLDYKRRKLATATARLNQSYQPSLPYASLTP